MLGSKPGLHDRRFLDCEALEAAAGIRQRQHERIRGRSFAVLSRSGREQHSHAVAVQRVRLKVQRIYRTLRALARRQGRLIYCVPEILARAVSKSKGLVRWCKRCARRIGGCIIGRRRRRARYGRSHESHEKRNHCQTTQYPMDMFHRMLLVTVYCKFDCHQRPRLLLVAGGIITSYRLRLQA